MKSMLKATSQNKFITVMIICTKNMTATFLIKQKLQNRQGYIDKNILIFYFLKDFTIY